MPTAMSQQELWKAVQEYGGYRPASREIGVPEATIRRKLKDYKPDLPEHAFIPDAADLPATHVEEGGGDTIDLWAEQQKKPGTRRYIITSAQNNCRVHEPFFENLKALAKEVDAHLYVSFTLYDRQGYRGLTRGDGPVKKNEVWWDKSVEEYAVNTRCRLHKRLAFCGELDILATARNPLSSLESYCGRSSLIVPHNKFAFQCVESRPHQMPKEMMTTGSVTRSRFIQRKAGQLAHFHHVIGALLVEVTDDGFWYAHHLNAEDDGSFYWLDRRVEGGVVTRTDDAAVGLILGDIHHEKGDDEQFRIAREIIRTHRPRYTFVHDLIDFRSRNHHNRKDPLFKVKVRQVSMADEIQDAAAFLCHLTTAANFHSGQVVVVKSNHDEALDRWIREADWREDPDNAVFYLTLALKMVEAIEAGQECDPLAEAIEAHWPVGPARPGTIAGPTFLKLDQSFEVEGIECGIHGHAGPSGVRGTPKHYSKLGFKTFTAHTHSPSIVDGCYTVGVTGNLDMEYNRGPSKWMHCHGLIYPNGKRAFLFVKGGKWRA